MFLFALCGNDLISIPAPLRLSQPHSRGLDCWVTTNLPQVKCSLMMHSDTPSLPAQSRVKMAWLISLLLNKIGETNNCQSCPCARQFLGIYMYINTLKCQSRRKTKPDSGESLFRCLAGRWHLLATDKDCGAPLHPQVFLYMV